MAIRSYGKLTKISVEDHIAVLQGDPMADGEVTDLQDAIAPEEVVDADADPETTEVVDSFLIGYDRGNNVPADAPTLSPDRDDPLVVDIDDGRVEPVRNRLGALKRVDTITRSMSKFNRHTGVWE